MYLAEVRTMVKFELKARNTLLSISTLTADDEAPFGKATEPEPGR